MSIIINFLLAIHILVSFLIVFLVLMQRPKSEGLGAAFGGGMTENLFGAQTTNVLQKFTRYLGGAFFVLTLALSVLYSKQASASGMSTIQKQLLSIPAPSAAPSASGSAKPGPQSALSPDASTEPLASPSPSAGLGLGTGVAPSATAVPFPANTNTAAPEASAQPSAAAAPSVSAPAASAGAKPSAAKKKAGQ
jgi:preprotein translocase subunit SecG